MRRHLGVWGRRLRTREVCLEPPVQVVALAEAADEDDARHDAALAAQAIHLALHEVAHFLDDRLEDVLDFGGC